MVALWFAALFGLGSLAIRPTLLEKFVLTLRLDLVVPAAAPPLGFTSRILLALMMFVIGAVIGFVVARKVARSGGERAQVRPARASAASFKAGAADDEDFDRLSAARPAQANPIPGRRRALAMEEDYVNDYRDHAPLPGHEPQILDLATLGGLSEYAGHEESEPAEPVIESQLAQAEDDKPAFDPWHRHAPEVKVADVFEEQAPANADAVVTEQTNRAFGAPAAASYQAQELPTTQPMDFHRPAFAAPDAQLAEPVMLQLEEVPAVIAQPPRAFDPAPFAVAENAPVAVPENITVPENTVAHEQAAPTVGLGLMPRDAVEKLTSAPLASLGVVQLAERLALAIARRRAPGEELPALVVPVAFESTPSVVPQPETIVSFAEPEPQSQPELQPQPEPEAVAPALAAEPAPAPAREIAIPRSMRPLHFGVNEQDEDDALESILPPRRFAMPATTAMEKLPLPVSDTPAPVAAEPTEEDESFGSLLGMKPSLRQSFVRVDEPVEPEAPVEPVVIFPGQAPRFASTSRPFEAPAQPAPAPIEVESPASTPIETGRRFGAPDTLPSTMAASASPAPSAIDPEETERALKAALATLQRMSGAA